MRNVEKIRKEFPITRNKTFLNHSAMSPLPEPVANVIHKCVDEISASGETSIEWNDGGKPLFARIIHAESEEIALVENTSIGLNVVANMLTYPRGSKIVTTDLEYPSVVYPWLRKRLHTSIDYVKNIDGKILLNDLDAAVDDNTVAIVISHVEYMNGFRQDLRAMSEIAHEHGAYLVVDAIQSAGVLEIDVERDNVDFLASACYKWLLSPPGAAYLYVKKQLIKDFEPPLAGWASVKPEVFETLDFWDIWSLRLSETASRFEVGSPSLISFVGATEALRMLLSYGIENIERRVLKLTDHLIEALKKQGLALQTPEDTQHRSGIVNYKIKNPQEAVQKLNSRGIIVSARAHGVRASPHFYNTEEEIDYLVNETKKIAR